MTQFAPMQSPHSLVGGEDHRESGKRGQDFSADLAGMPFHFGKLDDSIYQMFAPRRKPKPPHPGLSISRYGLNINNYN
jgi:hypothetical protein